MSEPYRYAVAEAFATIQGEASWTGTPSVFVRLMGCPVGCPWCDTRPTWDAAPDQVIAELPFGPRIGAVDPKARTMTHARMTAALIAAMARANAPARHAVITGGEPLMQPLGELVRALAAQRFDVVQIETSGTAELGDLPGWATGLWVTVSPKIGMPGGRAIVPAAVRRANEIKWPVGKPADLERLTEFLATYGVHPSVPVWLQPLSMSDKATALCVAAAQQQGRWRISVQTHKYLGLA